MRNLFLAGPLVVGVSPSEDEGGEDAVRFSGTASEGAAVVGVGSLGGSAGSTTATADSRNLSALLSIGGGEDCCLAGQERSSGCICVSAALILAATSKPLSFKC